MARRTEPGSPASAHEPLPPAGMKRRALLFELACSAGLRATLPASLLSPAADALAPSRRERLQESPVAGFQYHDGEKAWGRLRVGQSLQLRRAAEQ